MSSSSGNILACVLHAKSYKICTQNLKLNEPISRSKMALPPKNKFFKILNFNVFWRDAFYAPRFIVYQKIAPKLGNIVICCKKLNGWSHVVQMYERVAQVFSWSKRKKIGRWPTDLDWKKSRTVCVRFCIKWLAQQKDRKPRTCDVNYYYYYSVDEFICLLHFE